MKLLIFSDNHRDRDSVEAMIKKYPNIDRIISLGDSEMKEYELTNMNIFGVKGNYPFEPNFPLELTFVFEGVKMYFTHGHRYSVKMGLSRLLNYGCYHEIDIICFGHTHKPLLKEINGIIFLNPGALSERKYGASNSFAIVEITDTFIKIVIQTLEGEKIMESTKKR